MLIYMLMEETPDSYDIGTHLEPIQAFRERRDAVWCRVMLDGTEKRVSHWMAQQRWSAEELEIEEYDLV